MRHIQPFAVLAAASVALAAPLPTAHAQPTIERVAAGAVAPGAFPDAGFQHAFSFRATGFAPGSDGAAAIVGGSGACHAGDPCQSAVARDFVPGASTYFLGINFGGPFYGSPSLYINTSNTGTSGSELFLGGHDVDTPINAFYIVLTAPDGGAMALTNGSFIGAPPVEAPGFATGGPGSWYALYRYADLRNEFLFFDLEVTGNVAGAGVPSVDVYVGSLPVLATPEPATLALTASGLAALLAVARRGRLALSRTASSPRP